MGFRTACKCHTYEFAGIALTMWLLINCGWCGITDFERTALRAGEILYDRVGMYSLDDSPGTGTLIDSYVRFDVKFKQDDKELDEGEVQILLFYSDLQSEIGYVSSDGKDGKCGDSQIGQVIARNHAKLQKAQATRLMWNETLTFDDSDVVTPQAKRHHIAKTGIYYLYFINCKETGAGDLHLQGSVVWMNPYGYLPSERYPLFIFFGVMSLLYLLLGAGWFVLSALHWKQLLAIQNCIAGVIALGMIECTTWYFENLSYNLNGRTSFGAIVVGVFFTTFKRTVSRVLVLVVSMGYGVVKPSLGTAWYKVSVLGGLYFVFSGGLELAEVLQRGSGEAAGLALVFPVAILDTAFYWWIFVSLSATLATLSLRNQPLKLRMYRRLLAVLVGSVVVSVGVIAYQLLVLLTTAPDQRWPTWWLWTAFWHVLYFAILLAIAWLWRPTANNTRYAYSELRADDDGCTADPKAADWLPMATLRPNTEPEQTTKQSGKHATRPVVALSVQEVDDMDIQAELAKLE